MTTTIGPYTFSDTDVLQTLLHTVDLLDGYPQDVRPFQTARRERINTAISGRNPSSMSPDERAVLLGRVWPELFDARADLVAGDLLPATTHGTVAHLAVSRGGLPKLGVDRFEVDHGGAAGDRQATRRHHGRPWQALCLWSSEVIADLVGQGHPVGPGSAGENITIAGIDWGLVHPGVRLRMGDVLCQISAYAVPCFQTAECFSDREFNRIHHSQGQLSRIYATVLEPGTVGVGDTVVLEP